MIRTDRLVHDRHAASRGICLSTIRKNRVLRVLDLNLPRFAHNCLVAGSRLAGLTNKVEIGRMA
jgi:hypothetical protein